MASCSGSGSDPLRRQLALEELALIAEIGQEPGAVRLTTLVVLEAQREITGKQVTTAQLDILVASHSEEANLDLRDEDQAAIVTFLDQLNKAEIDWGSYANGWSTRSTDDGSGVALRAKEDTAPAGAGRITPPGMGGVTGPIAVAASPIAPASPPALDPPAAMDSLPTDSTTAPTPTVGHDATTTFMGMVTEHGRDGLLRWWPLSVVIMMLLLLGIGARRQPSETPTTWYVSRSRIFWLGRTLRRPPIVRSPRRRHGRVVVTTKR